MLIQQDEITIRLMQDEIYDYELIAKWLTDAQVLEFYEGRDNPFPLERIIETYKPMIEGNDPVVPCVFYYQNIPIGYLQYCALNDLSQTDRRLYHLEHTDYVYGIDLFIGETDYWNKGIGTKILSAIITYLFEHLQAHKIVIDPHVDNPRAIRCYEKCGFVKLKLLPAHELHEGKYSDCWLMAIDRKNSLHP
ncbi:acetyltransferase [Nostoc sp. UCD121]|uniref:GNAT family N-acetyltransferase n=1 Tax=unclassified Nostoc TaxID=2593658 RepID=UPI00162843BC|nr:MULTISPECIES: GNAT family N-acetyltransferase [unclassified Nostoc]MBC1219631.1 acetyltransferase [Nostoc sp. UCD120]MBC1275358.1 acetyltransferase [Nostoc sp. UCD121]MBC1299530.1 acetyltransferase [Nostoc sp. UCD122]